MTELDEQPGANAKDDSDNADQDAVQETHDADSDSTVSDESAASSDLSGGDSSGTSWNQVSFDANTSGEIAHDASKGDDVFQPLDAVDDQSNNTRDLDTVLDIPVRLNVELGRTRLTIKQLLGLTEGSIVELDGLAGDPMEIMINGHLVAQGEVVIVDDKYGIRITDIITAAERAQKLNR